RLATRSRAAGPKAWPPAYAARSAPIQHRPDRLRSAVPLAHTCVEWFRSTSCASMIAPTQPSCHNRLKSLNSFSVSLLVAGHDFGASVAAWCALVRPDVFRSVVLMSAPFGGPPSLPFNTVDGTAKPVAEDPIHRELAALPRPRKHYQWYYSTREANADMHHAPQGVHDFL